MNHDRYLNSRTSILTIALLLSLATAYTEIQAHSLRFIQSSQLQQHSAVIKHTAGNPQRYRVLSEWCLEAIIRVSRFLGISSPVFPFVAFRVGQNFLIFLLAAYYYSCLRLNRTKILLGMIFVSWGMSYAYRDYSLEFSTYSEVIFYLIAVLLILKQRDWWIPAVTFFAALNRETSALIPAAWLISRGGSGRRQFNLPWTQLRIFAISVLLYLTAFIGLRFWFGWKAIDRSWGHNPGFDMLRFNLGHWLTWEKMIWTLNVLPVICIFSFRSWPRFLKRLSGAIVPIWLVFHFFYLFIPETRLLLVPLVLIFVPGSLMLNEASDCLKVFISVVLTLAAITVISQLGILSSDYLERSQLRRHGEVIENKACNPWQYRVLSEWGVELFLKGGRGLGINSPVPPFIVFRLIQNIVIFALAALYYRQLGLNRAQVIFGLVLAGWGMSYAFYNSDLQFSTYSDIIFYLIAVLLILKQRDWWIPAVTFFAALNRETSALIPVAFVFGRIHFEKKRLKLKKKHLYVLAISFLLYLIVFVGLRWYFGWRSYAEEWKMNPGWGRFCSNICWGVTWQYFFLTVNILPILGIFTFNRWPSPLKRIFTAVVPLWVLVHFVSAIMAESRLLLVPHILVFVPGGLMIFNSIDVTLDGGRLNS